MIVFHYSLLDLILSVDRSEMGTGQCCHLLVHSARGAVLEIKLLACLCNDSTVDISRGDISLDISNEFRRILIDFVHSVSRSEFAKRVIHVLFSFF